MGEGAIAAVVTAIATVTGGWFLYRATRKRDEPSLQIEEHKAVIEDARVAAEAWGEMARYLTERLEKAEVRLSGAEDQLRTARDELGSVRYELRRCQQQEEVNAGLIAALEEEIAKLRRRR